MQTLVTEEKHTGQEDIGKVKGVFDQDIHPMTPLEYEKINDWLKDIEADVIIRAIEIATFNNKRHMGYINGILNKWYNLDQRSKDKDRYGSVLSMLESEHCSSEDEVS